ncbi:mobile mystery protein A (plasmid) [Bradyrhizobium barranii subsp. barranii]|uniref:Mobile mystery protein A n=1 Tax=Bradyrhizobium barranii subsp. barranii TaxID=2823807 RepID=A0A7Z0QME8_9BRAD|nr:mobile mystery protein A [Bradyrhizobium barranii]UGX89560.1 mobile mystery protein A [Bradyrhizobium barranii subsp. barranii]
MKDAIRHLDSRFATLQALSHAQRPPKGWIRAIRDALGMTTSQYAKRLGVSQPRIVELEKSEQGGSVTLNTLQRAAEALGCRLVYVLVPERPLAEVVTKRAAEVAERQSRAIEQTMRLEDQAVEDNQAARALREQAIEDLLKRPARLWDEE